MIRNCACYIVPCKHTVKSLNERIDVYEYCKKAQIARSVVDIRQPFFKDNGKLLTVSEKFKA